MKPRSHQQHWRRARRESVTRSQRKQGLDKPARDQGREKSGGGITGVEPPPRALILGWPQAQFMSYGSSWKEDLPRARVNILCKGWGTLRDHLAGHRRPRRPCTGAVGPPPGRECEQQGQGEGKPRVLPAHIGLYKRCLPAAGQDRQPGIQGKDSTIDQGVGSATSSFPGLPPKAGICPGVSACPWCRGT